VCGPGEEKPPSEVTHKDEEEFEELKRYLEPSVMKYFGTV
jgi:hypothetical protein